MRILFFRRLPPKPEPLPYSAGVPTQKLFSVKQMQLEWSRKWHLLRLASLHIWFLADCTLRLVSFHFNVDVIKILCDIPQRFIIYGQVTNKGTLLSEHGSPLSVQIDFSNKPIVTLILKSVNILIRMIWTPSSCTDVFVYVRLFYTFH